nr:hypothetical protein [uncultured Pedobacter sp.]
MPIIIDTNCIANVFSRSSANHENFSPVLQWVLKGKGVIVFGGNKYLQELLLCKKYLTIIRFLKEIGKVHIGNAGLIDQYERENKQLIQHKDFDDPHLAAIVKDTKCRIICSLDTTSIEFVTSPKLYPKRFSLPVYYTNSKNIDLLCDKYVDDTLKPLCKTTRGNVKLLEKIVSKL